MITRDQLASALPATLKSAATQELADKLNNITSDPELAEEMQKNFISYTTVLREGKFKTQDYLNAVVYVSYKLMGNSNQDAWAKTFPQRHAKLVAAGTSTKDISAHVHMYSRNKLVSLIMEQTLVPSWVLNQEVYQKAINVQADLMLNAQSEKVRSDAANSLLTHLAKPKESGPLINIDMRETSGMNELRDLLTQMAVAQQDSIQSGTSTKEIAGQRIIQGELVDSAS